MDRDISLVGIFGIITMSIGNIAIIIMIGMQNSMYHRILSCLDKLEQELKLGQDGKEIGSDDVKKKDN